jgi:hypothetical protein
MIERTSIWTREAARRFETHVSEGYEWMSGSKDAWEASSDAAAEHARKAMGRAKEQAGGDFAKAFALFQAESREGFVASLPRPGRNLTGFISQEAATTPRPPKRLA